MSATNFSKDVGRHQALALSKTVVVTRNGCDRTVMISAKQYAQQSETVGARQSAHDAGARRRPVACRKLDFATECAAGSFLEKIRRSEPFLTAMLFGSRARGTHTAESDADIAVILKGTPTDRYAALGPLSDAAFDVLMETGIHIQPLALWESELERPETFTNPVLIEVIKREGVIL